ncbi:hypothetical protein TH53_11925 [Pedobacter lusitanus]|uniref:Contig50, whole genome shotgun sequence n=1 Tax=Pedobacter lusitanus TaxID=1503925 RepID=A0A0D0GR26_9SPHI|nr:hypothetical protein [Pedobacter lusitanus]KIO76971.1 hypothetical protein TH53_11925 [Pedobacter lusitanus]
MSALQQILSKKTDKELLFYINNIDKHTDEAVRLALAELRKRNVELPDQIELDIEAGFKIRAIRVLEKKKEIWTENVEEYLEAPEYYTKRAIYAFSILFSILIGTFMIASNRKTAGKEIWSVILFGILYIGLAPFVMAFIHLDKVPYWYIANSAGTLIMYELFWNRDFGKDIKYRTKSIWLPSVFGLILFVFFLNKDNNTQE